LAFIAAGAVWTRQPPPSVTRVVGVSADTDGHPIVTELVAHKPDSQAVRTTVKDLVIRWFTIEPVLSDRLETSCMTANINSAAAQMTGAAAGQFRD
jgi:type IV secretion system protein TrbF